jgi:hypothetical protein
LNAILLTIEASVQSQVIPYLICDWHSGTGPVFFLSTFLPPVSIIPPMPNTHTHTHTHTHTYFIFKSAFTLRINGRNLGTFRRKWRPLGIWGTSTKKAAFVVFFFRLQGLE